MTVVDLPEFARQIRANFQEDDYAEKIKDLVQERLADANPGADVARTAYFNHSAIPDFVVTWGSQAKYPRPIYLRGSYAAILAAREAEDGRSDDPVFMSVNGETDFTLGADVFDRSRIARTVDRAGVSTTLVTDLTAFAAATQPLQSSAIESPLQSLVRSNFVRGGKGFFDDQKVGALVEAKPTGNDGEPSFLDEIADSFTEQVASEFQRTALLMDMTRDQTADILDSVHLLRGRLSPEEVRQLLPWILENATVSVESPLWRALGDLISLKMLEQESDSLRGLDLTRLVNANLDRFMAMRAYAGLSADPDSAEALGERWQMRGNTLERVLGAQAVRFAWLGTRLRDRGSYKSPRWSDLQGRIGSLWVTSATLHGVEQKITVGSRRGRNIREHVAASVPDGSATEFFVDDLRVRMGGESEPEVEVNFPARLVVAGAQMPLLELLKAVKLLSDLDPEVAADSGDADLEDGGDGAPTGVLSVDGDEIDEDN